MHLAKNLFGETVLIYDSYAELHQASLDFVDGRFDKLSAREVKSFQGAQDDPDGVKYDASHAGELVPNVDPDWVEGWFFAIGPDTMSFEDQWAWLRQLVGPHPLDKFRIMDALLQMLPPDWRARIKFPYLYFEGYTKC